MWLTSCHDDRPHPHSLFFARQLLSQEFSRENAAIARIFSRESCCLENFLARMLLSRELSPENVVVVRILSQNPHVVPRIFLLSRERFSHGTCCLHENTAVVARIFFSREEPASLDFFFSFCLFSFSRGTYCHLEKQESCYQENFLARILLSRESYLFIIYLYLIFQEEPTFASFSGLSGTSNLL